MKSVMLGILLATMALGLVACSSTAPEPGADTSVATPASSNGAAGTPAPKPAAPPAPKMVEVPANTALEVLLDSSLSSDKSNAGDKFEASLAAPLVVDGATVLEKGTKFHGKVVAAEGSGRVKGLASITLALTDVMHDGKMTPITTKNWGREAENTKKKDAVIVGGAAAVGTAIGGLLGGKKGAAEGAAVGGGAGVGTVLATKGKEVELGPEARIKFTLEKSFDIAAR